MMESVFQTEAEDAPQDSPGCVERASEYVMTAQTTYYGSAQQLTFAEVVIKQAVEDITEFFKSPLYTKEQLYAMRQVARFRALEAPKNAAQSLGWLISEDQPPGNKLSFSECCHALCADPVEMREGILKVLKSGPKSHWLYLRDNAEELLK